MKSKTLLHSFILIFVAFIWGSSFVAQDTGGNLLGPFFFNGIRSFLACFILLPTIKILDFKYYTINKPSSKSDYKKLLFSGILCGLFLFLASSFQQLGIYYKSSVGKAGFLTACYIFIVPILSYFIGKKCSFNVWISVFIALIGLYLLCISKGFSIAFSDMLLLICSLLFSLQVITIDYFITEVDGIRLAFIQMFSCAVLSIIASVIFDMHCSLEGFYKCINSINSSSAIIAILYAGILSSGIGYTLQIVGQKGLNPTLASLLMSLESVFSVLAGYVFLNQVLTSRQIIGCIFMFSAIVLAQLDFKKK